MSAALAYRPADLQPRHSDGKFGAIQRAEDVDLMGSLTQRCSLCVTCQALRDGADTGDECAVVTGRGSCVLTPQSCSCEGCGARA